MERSDFATESDQMITPRSPRSGSSDASDPRIGRTWTLPLDATCAGVARSVTGDALAASGLPMERIREAELMVSELATNAHEHARGHPPHELWLYPVRTHELVCAVFDARSGSLPPVTGHPWRCCPADGERADFGRGLTLVDGLSGGRWGVHLTRSRLGGSVPGKVVWFGLPLPSGAGRTAAREAAPATATDPAVDLETGPEHDPETDPPAEPKADPEAGPERLETAAHTLKDLLIARGVRPVYVSHRDALWVVAVPYGLTVWIRGGRFELPGCRTPVTEPLTELPVVLEHLIRRYEQHRLADT